MPNAVYDEHLLVTLLANGEQTYAQVAERVGITESMVGKIARGESRRGLYERICRRVKQFRRRSRNLISSWQPNVLKKHIAVGMEADGETARKCREFLLKPILETLGRPDPDEDTGGFDLVELMRQLSGPTRQKVMDELSGAGELGRGREQGR